MNTHPANTFCLLKNDTLDCFIACGTTTAFRPVVIPEEGTEGKEKDIILLGFSAMRLSVRLSSIFRSVPW